MRRCMFNFAVIVSALLWVVMAAIALRSVGMHGDSLSYLAWGRPVHGYTITLIWWQRERIGVVRSECQAPEGHKLSGLVSAPPGWDYQRLNSMNPGPYHSFREWWWHFPRQLLHYSVGTAWYESRRLSVPLWPLIVATSVLPGLWLYGALRRRGRRYRLARGLCARCGYDLRATAEAGGPLLERCPECGSAAHASATSR